MIPKLVYFLLSIYWKIFKPKTFGARALIINNGKVLLVKHTYLPEWYLPGGGLKVGETFEKALKREIKEELGIAVKNFRPFGTYINTKEGKIDTEKIYLIKENIDTAKMALDNRETRELKFFKLNSLPKNISPGTLRKIQEYKSKKYQLWDFGKIQLW